MQLLKLAGIIFVLECLGLIPPLSSSFKLPHRAFVQRKKFRPNSLKHSQTEQKSSKPIYHQPEPWQVGVIGAPGAGCTTLKTLLSLLPPVSITGDDDSVLADVRLVDCPDNSTLATPPLGTLMGFRKSGFYIHVVDAFSKERGIPEQIQEVQRAMAQMELLAIKDRRRKKNTRTFWRTMGKMRGRRELWALDKIERELQTVIENGGTINYNDILYKDEQKAIQPAGLIGFNKEVLYVLNIDDTAEADYHLAAIEQIQGVVNVTKRRIFSIPLKSELEINQLPQEQQHGLRREYGLNSEHLQSLCSAIAERQPVRDVKRYVPFFLRTVLDAPPQKQVKKTKSRSAKYYANEIRK